jgi:PAS domain S-box-containing protein
MNNNKHSPPQAYLAAIVESSDDAILSKDTNGIIQSCNAAGERIFGYRAGELVGQPVRILIPPERQPEEDDILARIRRGERVDHFETVRVRKDGRLIDVSLTVSPVLDENGNVIGASKIARDITEQKRARALQAYLAAIVTSSSDAIITKDLNGIIQSCNASCERMFGYSAAELVGRSILVLIPQERHSEEAMILDKMRRGERIEHFETVRVAKDGRRLDISLSLSPIKDERGTVIGVAKVARDITAQKRLARDLAAQEERFRVTLASIGDAVIASDMRGRISFMNPVAERLTAWRLDDARGRPCADVFRIVNEESRQTVESPVDRVLAEGTVVGLANHTILIAADGSERPIDDSGAPIRDRNGGIVGVVLVFRDITERKRAEADKRAVAAERERLLEAERAARSEAERASRVKDEFVATVSHELRTPLNAILGWAHLMEQSPADADVVRRGLDVIARNTRIQAQLISDLLDMSRIVSGKLRLLIEKVELPSLVQTAVDSVQHAATAKRIAVHAQLDPVQVIAGDPARLQQIIWNLLWNAVKFTPEGGRVDVHLRQSGTDVELVVRDTGVGIDPAFLPHVFERFQQGNPSITRRFGGLGLGLSIVRHLVDLHGGTVRAESAGEGQGAAFTVRLPSGGREQAAVEPRAAGETAAARLDALDGIRILVVEDERDTREFLGRLLVGYGAEVVVAASAAEALALLPGTPVNFLISDIGLPNVDGYELLQRIRRMDGSSAAGIPAIALTAYARAQDRLLAFRAGYQAHIAKPIDPAELVAAIVDLAQLSRVPAAEQR